jgi:hypothetical protein
MTVKATWANSGFNGFRGARFLVFCVVFCRSLFVLLRFTDSDYPFAIFKFLSFYSTRIMHVAKQI